MTLIECFNHSLVENITGCLRQRPDKLILLGEEKQMSASAQRYRTILRQRGLKTRIFLCDIQGKNMEEISAVLTEIVRKEKDCTIDLTGGDELVIMAVGVMLAGMSSRDRSRISVQKYDIREDTGVDCIGSGRTVSGRQAALSVPELIALHGGIIHHTAYQPPESCTPAQLRPLWDVVAQSPKDWNRTISVLGEFESRSDSKTEVFLPLEYMRGSIENFVWKERLVRQLLDRLDSGGVIENHSTGSTLSYAYTSPLFRYCTQKAGNVLEIKTLLEARALQEAGEPFFYDCRTGVTIDWDGVIYDPADRIPETRNEMDLILMHGLTPLFVSCKNGNSDDEELYKLHTVAERFGGPYARKMLIATDLDRGSAAADRAFAQRAWDMDIFLVTDAAELTSEEWQQTFRKAML